MTKLEQEQIYNNWNRLRNEEIEEDNKKEREEARKVLKEIAKDNGTEYEEEDLQYRVEGSRAIELLLQIINIAQTQIDLLSTSDYILYKRSLKIEGKEQSILKAMCELQELIAPTV